MLTLGVPTYRRYDLMGEMIASVLRSSMQPQEIIIIDNGGGFGHPHWLPSTARVVTPGHNIGVAAAWNAIMDKSAHDRVLIVNDDVTLAERSIENLMSALDRGATMAVAESGGGSFSCFAITKALFARVGRFDEQFYPAYFEDGDYHRRMRLLGEDFVLAHTDGYRHGVSQTIATYSSDERRLHDDQFVANRQRYLSKWGGLPGSETFLTPYGR